MNHFPTISHATEREINLLLIEMLARLCCVAARQDNWRAPDCQIERGQQRKGITRSDVNSPEQKPVLMCREDRQPKQQQEGSQNDK